MPNLSDLNKAKSAAKTSAHKKTASKPVTKRAPSSKPTSPKRTSSKPSDNAKISSEALDARSSLSKGFSKFLGQIKKDYGNSAEEKRADTATKPKAASKPPSKVRAWGARPTAASESDKPEAPEEKPKGLFGRVVDQVKDTINDPKFKDELAERKKEEGNHLRNLESHYSLFDNPGGGKTDGTISLKDIERVAKGDYDDDAARQKLRDQGVPESKIDDQIRDAKETANFLLENDGLRGRLDTANDGDNKTDDKISRGDLDKVLVSNEKDERENRITELERKANEPPSEEHVAEARTAVERWSKPGALENELREKPLSEFSSAELDALAAVNQDDPKAQKQIEEAVLRSVGNAENLDDLPKGDAFNYLLQNHVTGKKPEDGDKETSAAKAQEQLSGLVRDEIEGKLDERLHDRRGDKELDLALDRFSGNLEDLAIENPALVDIISQQAESTAADFSDEFTEVARRDDNRFQKFNHAVTGGFRDGVGFVTDRFREAVELTARINSVPARLAGRGINLALDAGGTVAGAGLDAVGADGAADRVRKVTDEVGDFAQDGIDFLADQNEGFVNGLGESVAGTVDGVAYVVTDPKGTVEGIGALIQDPSLLLEGYKETAEEHGAAGVAGQVVGDVALTVLTGGGGAAAKGSGLAGRFANFASKGGRAGRVLGRAANGAQRFLNVLDDPASAASRLSARTGARGGRFANGVTRAADGAESLFRNVRQTKLNAGDGVRRRLDDGLNVLDNVPGVDKFRQGVGRISERLRGSDARGFQRASREFHDNHPGLINRIDKSRDAVEHLRGAGREEIGAFIDKHLDLATELDSLSSSPAPRGVGETVVSGRENVLKHIQEQLPNLDPDQARRLVRGVLADSDPSGPVHLTKLSPDDQVFRAFDSGGDADGSYFGRAQDRRLSPDQLQANNSLPGNNRANRGVLLEPEDGSLAVVSRVGPQGISKKFPNGAPGGGWQLQFYHPSRLEKTLKKIADNLARPSMPSLPFRIADPRRGVVSPPVAKPGVIIDEELQEQESRNVL